MFFFFQAEDGIRDYKVTGVQTCALPISRSHPANLESRAAARHLPSSLSCGLSAWLSILGLWPPRQTDGACLRWRRRSILPSAHETLTGEISRHAAAERPDVAGWPAAVV